jgi:hypothetical protein
MLGKKEINQIQTRNKMRKKGRTEKWGKVLRK